MVTINIKGKPNPKDKQLVKLEMIFFKTGYARVSKVIYITGPYKDWDQEAQIFKAKSSQSAATNKNLIDLKLKYLKVAEAWDAQEQNWSPVEWSHCFDEENKEKDEVKVLSVSQVIDHLIERFKKQERFKNGTVISSSSNAEEYAKLKRSLDKFTRQKYNKSFSSYYFQHITETFLLDYVLYLQKRGAEEGHKGAVVGRLKKFYAVFNHARKINLPKVDPSIFKCVEEKMKYGEFEPKTIPYEIIRKIENIDRCKFSNLECFHIDLFLFSFYAGGMANIDVAYLKHNCIKGGIITYERVKFSKEVKIPLINKAKDIVERYKERCFSDFVLPVFSHKHKTEQQQRDRVERLSSRVNKTLEKVRKEIKYKEKITWYSARGTFITKMIDEGCHPMLVAQLAGISPEIIYKHYYKTTKDKDDIKQMNELF